MDAAAGEPTAVEAVPPIRFIPFEQFKIVGSVPRFPNNHNIYVSLDDIDVDNSLLIYISWCWERGWAGAQGYDGRPHPDNPFGGKYALCIDGIEQIMKIQAPGFERCYIWADYSCIDQDRDPAGELKQLDKIVGACDCLFTPIYDENHSLWTMTTTGDNAYEFDKSPGWRGNAFSYLSRGWCRMEMFYGTNIPFAQDSKQRKQKMRRGLLQYRSSGRRPHFMYGSKLNAERSEPLLLPPFEKSYLEEYHPVNGNLSVASDKEKIIQLVRELEEYIQREKEHRVTLGKQLLIAAHEDNFDQLRTLIEEGADVDFFLEVSQIMI
jgi:molybdopterin converting factor small subunit